MDISASVKVYFALKLSGVSQDDPCLARARTAILANGGVVLTNVFTKITLALFGQYDWQGIPSMPPEIILAPNRFYFNIYPMSYWSRAVIVPLLIISRLDVSVNFLQKRALTSCFSLLVNKSNIELSLRFRKIGPLSAGETFSFGWMEY